MSENRSHKITANRLAKKFKTDYNQGQGADIKTNKMAIEVETEDSVSDAVRQLKGYQKPVYVAGTNQAAVDKALKKFAGTKIGVMNNQGKIIKKSTRGK